jgi:hypothetical protein
LAQFYLLIPASSASSERAFSLSGILLDKKRSRLEPDLVNDIMFLNSHYRYVFGPERKDKQ